MYLAQGSVKAADLAIRIVTEILCTTRYVVMTQHSDSWWIIACEEDWLGSRAEGSAEEFFRRIVPSPKVGVNAFYGEVLLTVFADDVITATSSEVVLVKGSVSEIDPIWSLIGALPERKRVVAFRVLN